MRKALAAVLVASICGGLASGQAVTNRSTTQILNQVVLEVSFQDAPFDQVMAWIGDTLQINVVVRWNRLEELGVERDTPISIQAQNLRASQILWMIMSEAGGTDVKLAYRASGNLLVMSTANDLGQELIVKVYDIGDLLLNVPRFVGPRVDLSQLQQSGQGGSGQSIFGQGNQQQQDPDEQQQGNNQNQFQSEGARQLIELIQTTVEPDSWQANGGLGTIRAYRNQIVVRNNILVHQALGGPLEEE